MLLLLLLLLLPVVVDGGWRWCDVHCSLRDISVTALAAARSGCSVHLRRTRVAV